jgi:hypothetical protein
MTADLTRRAWTYYRVSSVGVMRSPDGDLRRTAGCGCSKAHESGWADRAASAVAYLRHAIEHPLRIARCIRMLDSGRPCERACAT